MLSLTMLVQNTNIGKAHSFLRVEVMTLVRCYARSAPRAEAPSCTAPSSPAGPAGAARGVRRARARARDTVTAQRRGRRANLDVCLAADVAPSSVDAGSERPLRPASS